MLSVSRYDRNLKLINKYLFGQEYDNDKNTKLEKIKQFQEVLTQFVRDHEKTVNIDDIRQFINGQKQNLSEIEVKDPECRLLAVLLPIYENNNLKSVQDFLNLISEFDIKNTCIVFNIKYNIYRCYVCSQNLTYEVFKEAVNGLLSCNYLQMKTFKNFIELCFKQDKDKTLQKGDCFNYIFKLLKERFHEGNIKNICSVRYLLEMIIYTFGCDVIQSADESIFEYILNLTKNLSNLGSSDTCFSNWFKVFSSFKAEFWNSSDLKDECWIAQYSHFWLTTLDTNCLKYRSVPFRNGLYIQLTNEDIVQHCVFDKKEDYKCHVQYFIEDKYILPETRLMVMYCCSQLYGTDTKFLKKISADNFSKIDDFFSICEKVKLTTERLADCLYLYSMDEIVDFIRKHGDINEDNRWKFLAVGRSIVERCKEEKSQTKIDDFFKTPDDLFDFYEKIHLEFSDYDLMYCLKKYKDDEIVAFIRKHEHVDINENNRWKFLAIWISIVKRCEEEKSQININDFFKTPDDLFGFYEKIHLEFSDYDLMHCLKKYKDDEIVAFIQKHEHVDINEDNRWKFWAVWRSIVERCEEEKSQTKIDVFFETPDDLFGFYEKTHLEFSYDKFLGADKNADNVQDIFSRFDDLRDCLRKYEYPKMADFIQRNNEPCKSMFTWASLMRYKDWCKNLFKKPKDIIDFYINKVPNELKNLEDLYVFLHVGYIYNDKGLWQNYFKSILEDKQQNHIQLFLDFFDGSINFEAAYYSMESNIRTIQKSVFSNFNDLKSFLEFYMEIYSNSDKNSLETKNIKRDHILNLMIHNCEWDCGYDRIKSLLNMCDKKYDFFVPFLINNIILKDRLDLCDLSYIVQFLSKKNDLNKDLKNKLLKKIDDQVKERVVGLLGVSYDETFNRYHSDAFIYPNDFQSELKYVIEIMNSKDVLPETKKKIYDWAKDALEQDEKKWQCVLEMYVYHIEKDKQPKNDIDLSGPSLVPTFIIESFLNLIQQNPNNSNKNDKNNKYERLRYYDIGGHKNLTTLKSHQDDWHLADLKNSDELRNLRDQIDNLSTQINTLQNKLNKTEFKLDWILIIWLSLIGTIVLLGARYYWDSSKNSLNNTKNTLSTRKQNLENTIRPRCEKKKADYEDSLSKAKTEMKKWGKCKQSENYPYDKHEEYCKGLKQIINTYERGKNLNQDIDISNSGDKISPLEEQQQENDIIIYEDEI